MFNMGVWDWVIVGGIVFVLFGGKRLPELAKGIGKSITAFKQGLKEIKSDVTKETGRTKQQFRFQFGSRDWVQWPLTYNSQGSGTSSLMLGRKAQ